MESRLGCGGDAHDVVDVRQHLAHSAVWSVRAWERCAPCWKQCRQPVEGWSVGEGVRHCGSTCRFGEPVFAGLRQFPEGAFQGLRRLDTSPGALPSRPQTTQVPRCSAQLSSLMTRRPSIHASA